MSCNRDARCSFVPCLRPRPPSRPWLGLLLAIGPGVLAADADVPEAQAGPVVELHRGISAAVQNTADYLDGFFGDARADEERAYSHLRVRLEAFGEQGEGFEPRGAVSGKLVLPQFEERLRLLFSAEDEDLDPLEWDLFGDDREGAGDESVAVRYVVREKAERSLKADVGVRNRSSVEGFGRMRYRHTVGLGRWGARLTNNLYWFTESGWEDTLALDLERGVGARDFFRSTTQAEWTEDDEEGRFRQDFSLFHPLDRRRVVAYEWRTLVHTEPETEVEETELRVRYRANYRWPWLYLEAAPAVAFPEHRDYDATWRLTLSAEVFFGGEYLPRH